ncbi:ABC transporter ATP-binding protein [Gammaproteobacteria bacterium]|nr:ABC transporter ATP-binding protein [Gammaproteobacteria bacterium]
MNNISFEMKKGEIVCLLGPSGCGKTSTLRLIAGLETPSSGSIYIGEKCVSDNKVFVEPHKRDIGFLFQDFALFPHLTAKENIAWGLSGGEKRKREIRIQELLEQTSLNEHKDKYPHELSGGEQQRVSLARALAPRPRLMLLDEPFSSLDTNLRQAIRDETIQILKETDTTAIMVTHDPEEAMLIADKIILMNKGKIQQEGTAQDLYENPENKFIASFLGYVNQVTGIVNGDIIETDIGKLPNHKFSNNSELDVIIRPQALSLSKKTDNSHEPAQAIIESIKFTGTARHIWANVETPEGAINKILVIQDHKEDLKIDDKVHLQIDPKKSFIFQRI